MLEEGVTDGCSPWACRGNADLPRDDFGLATCNPRSTRPSPTSPPAATPGRSSWPPARTSASCWPPNPCATSTPSTSTASPSGSRWRRSRCVAAVATVRRDPAQLGLLGLDEDPEGGGLRRDADQAPGDPARFPAPAPPSRLRPPMPRSPSRIRCSGRAASSGCPLPKPSAGCHRPPRADCMCLRLRAGRLMAHRSDPYEDDLDDVHAPRPVHYAEQSLLGALLLEPTGSTASMTWTPATSATMPTAPSGRRCASCHRSNRTRKLEHRLAELPARCGTPARSRAHRLLSPHPHPSLPLAQARADVRADGPGGSRPAHGAHARRTPQEGHRHSYPGPSHGQPCTRSLARPSRLPSELESFFLSVDRFSADCMIRWRECFRFCVARQTLRAR